MLTLIRAILNYFVSLFLYLMSKLMETYTAFIPCLENLKL